MVKGSFSLFFAAKVNYTIIGTLSSDIPVSVDWSKALVGGMSSNINEHDQVLLNYNVLPSSETHSMKYELRETSWLLLKKGGVISLEHRGLNPEDVIFSTSWAAPEAGS